MTCVCLRNAFRARTPRRLGLLLGAPVAALGLAWWAVAPSGGTTAAETAAEFAAVPLQTLIFIHRGDVLVPEAGRQ
jgi:hypothetical protein